MSGIDFGLFAEYRGLSKTGLPAIHGLHLEVR